MIVTHRVISSSMYIGVTCDHSVWSQSTKSKTPSPRRRTMSEVKKDSVPPSGNPTPEPSKQLPSEKEVAPVAAADPPTDLPILDEDDELFIIKAVNYIKARWIRFVLSPILLVLLVSLDHYQVMDWRVFGTLMVIIGIIVAYFRIIGKESFLGTLKTSLRNTLENNKKKMLVLAFFAPLLAPFLFHYCGGAYTTDFDQVMDPPVIYVDWNVNYEVFDKENKILLASQSPFGRNQDWICGMLLLAAKAANIEATDCAIYDPSRFTRKKETFVAVAFESYTVKELLPPPPAPMPDKESKEPPAAPPEPRYREKAFLGAYFIVHKGDDESGFSKIPTRQDVEGNQITLGFLAKGFREAMGQVVSDKAKESSDTTRPSLVDGKPALNSDGAAIR